MQEILEKYWSQVLLLIGGIGIILKMIFSFILKKREIRHEIFHQSKMDALIRFYNAYAEMKNMWRIFPIYRISKDGVVADDYNLILPPLNKLDASIIELQVYFTPVLYNKFKKIQENMFEMNGHFSDIASISDSDSSVEERTNDFHFFRRNIEKLNSEILSEINLEIAKKY